MSTSNLYLCKPFVGVSHVIRETYTFVTIIPNVTIINMIPPIPFNLSSHLSITIPIISEHLHLIRSHTRESLQNLIPVFGIRYTRPKKHAHTHVT